MQARAGWQDENLGLKGSLVARKRATDEECAKANGKLRGKMEDESDKKNGSERVRQLDLVPCTL